MPPSPIFYLGLPICVFNLRLQNFQNQLDYTCHWYVYIISSFAEKYNIVKWVTPSPFLPFRLRLSLSKILTLLWKWRRWSSFKKTRLITIRLTRFSLWLFRCFTRRPNNIVLFNLGSLLTAFGFGVSTFCVTLLWHLN